MIEGHVIAEKYAMEDEVKKVKIGFNKARKSEVRERKVSKPTQGAEQ